MENKLEYGTDWNLHENLKAFKNNEQNIYKTSQNIKNIFKYKNDCEKSERLKNFEADQYTEQIRLESEQDELKGI